MMTENELREIAHRRMKKGEQLKNNAAFGGDMVGDRGGSSMINEALAFLSGLNKTLPSGWAVEVQQHADHETEERRVYKRLKRKFGDE